MPNYPDLEGYAYSWQRTELTIDRNIYTGISGIEIEQATEEGVVMGTQSMPLARTVGQTEAGQLTVTFSDEVERVRLLKNFGNAYREKLFNATVVLSAPGRENVRIACTSCRILNNPVSYESGTDALGGDVVISFLRHTINGLSPHSGGASPTRP